MVAFVRCPGSPACFCGHGWALSDRDAGRWVGLLLSTQELQVDWAHKWHRREDTSCHHQVFVGDLSQNVFDQTLYSAFANLPGLS